MKVLRHKSKSRTLFLGVNEIYVRESTTLSVMPGVMVLFRAQVIQLLRKAFRVDEVKCFCMKGELESWLKFYQPILRVTCPTINTSLGVFHGQVPAILYNLQRTGTRFQSGEISSISFSGFRLLPADR